MWGGVVQRNESLSCVVVSYCTQDAIYIALHTTHYKPKLSAGPPRKQHPRMVPAVVVVNRAKTSKMQSDCVKHNQLLPNSAARRGERYPVCCITMLRVLLLRSTSAAWRCAYGAIMVGITLHCANSTCTIPKAQTGPKLL